MTISPQRLDEIDGAMECGTDADGVERTTLWNISFDESMELIRLARLGLWAEQHAIPAFERILGKHEYDINREPHKLIADEAIAALPPQAKE